MEGKGEIGHGSWVTRSVIGNDEIETRSRMGNDKRATRSVIGNDSADEIGFGWIGLRW